MYYPIVRKALFQLDPERAHELTFSQLRRITGTPLEFLIRQSVPSKPVSCMVSPSGFRAPRRQARGVG